MIKTYNKIGKALSTNGWHIHKRTITRQITLKSNFALYESKFDLEKPNLAFYKQNYRLQTDTGVLHQDIEGKY